MADVALFIGRFQPVHTGHLSVALRALDRHDHLIIAIGSSNRSRRHQNPFTFEERREMWERSLGPQVLRRVSFIPLDDNLYSDNEWIAQVRHRVNELCRLKFGSEKKIALTGHMKDDTSYYLRFFPEWESDLHDEQYHVLSSTEIREFFYTELLKRKGNGVLSLDQYTGTTAIRGLPRCSTIWDSKPLQNALYTLAKEWDFDRGYDPTKFPVIVQTVDAVVVQNGHVLTVRRKNHPGKGMMALPGGHPEALTERLEDAMLRELREETGIDFSDRVLRANIKAHETFDEPNRSSRGRVITTAYLIKLPDEPKLAKVKGADDAEQAFWTPLSEVRADDWFEDHAFIIKKMTAGL